MLKKSKILFLLVVFLSTSAIYSFPNNNNPNQRQQNTYRTSSKISPQIEFFAGFGYFSPSLKSWNNAVKDFNSQITGTDGFSIHDFRQVSNDIIENIDNSLVDLGNYTRLSSGESYLAANTLNHFGIKYFFNNNFSLSLSVAYFKADASTKFFAESHGIEKNWPYFGYSVSDELTIGQEIKSFPTLLTIYYQPPSSFVGDLFDFYVGGGVGYYFSQVKTGITKNYMMDHSKGNADWDQVDISSDPVNSNIVSNIRANANPFGYHVSAGLNYAFKNIVLNFEAGYHYAVAKLDNEDWTFFTRNYTPIKVFEGKNYSEANMAYEIIYMETRKYFLEIPESAYESLKIKEIDFSGFMLKGGIGFAF